MTGIHRGRAPGVIAGAKTAIGFRVKSGRAIAVVLRGPVESPSPVAREVVELCDPGVAETRQPYHSGLGQAEQDPKTIARRGKIIERAASASVSGLAAKLGLDPLERGRIGSSRRVECRAALVTGSVIDPESVGNPHIRAHAYEGRLFRTVLEQALAAHGITASVIVERQLAEKARRRLGLSDRVIKQRLAELGKAFGSPWRSDEKAAATAAWMALADYNSPP
jgi:hypothetical protein